MSNDAAKVIDMASRITAMAEGAVANLDRVIAPWPGEFRAIMWEAVMEVARHRAEEAKVQAGSGK